MGLFDGIVDFIVKAILQVVQPVLAEIINVFAVVLKAATKPIMSIIFTLWDLIFNTILKTIVNTVCLSLFNKENGWDWLVELFMSIVFIVGYVVFLYGYAFAMLYSILILQFLPLSILIFLFVLPVLPLAHFIYSIVTTFLEIPKSSNENIVIYIINQIKNSLDETRRFFVEKWLNILLKLILIFVYLIFLFIYDLFITLLPIVTQLVKIGMTGQIVLNIIVYYPIWWFIYSFLFEKQEISDIPNRILEAMNSVTDTITFAFSWLFDKVKKIVTAIMS